jgi:ABC-type phosphate transport system substrate-binding protein
VIQRFSRATRSLGSVATAAALLASSVVVSAPAAPAVLAATCTPTAAGSTTVQPVITPAAPVFNALARSGNCNLSVAGGGSNVGLAGMLTNPTASNIGDSSRPLGQDWVGNAGQPAQNTAELANLWGFKIATDAVVFQVSSSATMNFVTKISPNSVKQIILGNFQFWDDLPAGEVSGAPHTAIIMDCRATSSGSRSDVMVDFGFSAAENDNGCDNRLASSNAEATAAQTDFHLVYTSLLNIGVAGTKELPLSGGGPLTTGIGSAGTFVAPTTANVAAGTYPAPRPLLLAVRKWDPNNATDVNRITTDTNTVKALDFINFMMSSQGQGFIGTAKAVQVPTRVVFPASDVNLDGVVSLPDLGRITSRWGQTDASTPGWIRADAAGDAANANGPDGVVSLPDIGKVTSVWGSTAPGNAFQINRALADPNNA